MKTAPGPRRWSVPDPATPGGNIGIAGWDFGGSGPLALLHHANGFCAATWGLLAAQLTAHYHVFAVDARGHGDSDSRTVPEGYRWSYFVSDLLEVAEQLRQEFNTPQIAYGIGSSLGGVITAAAEAARPGLFQRIAMLDPPIQATPALLRYFGLSVEEEASAERKSSLVEMTRRRRRIWASRDEARAAWKTKPIFAPLRPEAFELYLQEGLVDQPDGTVALKCHPDVEAHIFATAGELDPRDFAPKVQAPALLVRATGGHFRRDFFEALITLFPRGTLVELEAGHLLPMEAPELTIQALLAFAADLDEDDTVSWLTSKN